MRFLRIILLCILTCTLTIASWAQSARAAPDRAGFALLVDISGYRENTGISPLQWKSREVDRIKDALSSAGGFPESQIHVLTDENATREGIIESLTAIVEDAQAQADARFFLYVKGRSLALQGKRYFLPYDARVGAPSTYIEEAEIENWLNRVRFPKVVIQATWGIGDQDDLNFSSALADLLSDAKTDSNNDRNVTLAEMKAAIRQPGSGEESPIRISGEDGTTVIKLPSMLFVTSDPSGATVLLDDVEKGLTPAQLVDLTPGTHQLYVKSERHRIPAKQTVSIASARGQRMIATSYKLIPIKVHGTVDGVDREIIRDVNAQIEGTEYRQTVTEDGSFSFEEWQNGLLESGKVYEILAQSPDGLYSGKASFTFSGTKDILLTVSLTQSNWIKVAEQHLVAGNIGRASAMLDAKLQMSETGDLLEDEAFATLQPALARVFLTHLESECISEPDNLKARIVAARLADLTGGIYAARRHWKVIKAGAAKDTAEYKAAAARLRQTNPMRKPWVIALIVACVITILAICGAVGVYVYKRIQFSKFREIPRPYIAGKPISERDMFFGREDIFAFIKDKFSRDAKDITIVLYGGRRTGKTSIMRQIENGRLGETFMPVFIDMQAMPGVDAHDFFRSIAQKVSEVYSKAMALPEDEMAELDKLCRNLEDKSKPAYESFNEFLASISSTLEDKYIILLIDEYEILERKVNDGSITHEIFTYLRHLMQNFTNLAFIFSGSSDFGKREREEWKLTFNMAIPREISFLSRADAIALITEPAKDYMRYDRKAVERILRLTAGHPFFTQAVCQQIIEDMNDRQQNKVTVAYVDEACRDIVENAPFHLAFLWGELSSEEKIMVALLAEILPDGLAHASIGDIVSKQSEYELEYDRATISKTLTKLVGDHLVEMKPGTDSYRFRMDLIRAWLQSEHPIWGVLKEVQNHE